MSDVATEYAGGRARLCGLVGGLDEAGGAAPVPACPRWSVKHVVAHVAGICSDILAGNLDGLATEPWTAAQVEARRALPLAEIVAEWDHTGPQVEALIPGFPPTAAAQLLTDLITHEQDVRGVLHAPGARDRARVGMACDFAAAAFLSSLHDRGIPPLRLRAGDRVWVAGDDEPAATLEADAFELLRAVTGRRSLDQIRALGWDADPAPWLGGFTWGPFTPPA
jgi:uncharacterized protein (TIGR03083 family)